MKQPQTRPARPELLSPIPYAPDSPRGLKLKITGALLMLAAGLALFYYGHTVLRETADSRRFPVYLLAAALLPLALLDLWHYRRRWRQLQQLRTMAAPLAHRLPPRRPSRHSYQCRFSSLLDLPLQGLGILSLLAGFAVGISYFLLSLLISRLPKAPQPLPRKSWQRWRCGYDAATDCFHLAWANYLGSYRRLYQRPAAEFCGLYQEEGLIWLAGLAGGVDVLLAELDYWYRSNDAAFRALLAKLSAASGLPVLYRWPAPPLSLMKNSGPIS